MVQVVVSALSDHLKGASHALAEVIDNCLIEALSYPSERRYYRFVPLEVWQLIYPSDRSERYTIVEIKLFAGRTEVAIRNLIHLLYERLPPKLGVRPLDLEFIIQEIPRHRWGLRGLVADEYDLGYSLSV